MFIYLCGPTLYDRIHIGNARSLVVFDVIAEYHRRTTGVTYIRNITDFDDKIIAKSKEGDPAKWVNQNTLDDFRSDCSSLGLKAPDVEPKASQYVSEMISYIGEMAEYLEMRDDGVYLAPPQEHYGSLSNRKTNDPFCVWKYVTDGTFSWESPWGNGRPGWHTECATMIKQIAGTVDLHGGGNDLKFPHHENENIQSICNCGKHIAKSWLHVGTVLSSGRKMAKSDNNFFTVADVAKDFDTQAIRIALLMTNPTKPFEFSLNRMKEAEAISQKRPDQAFHTIVPWHDQQMKSLANGYRTRII